MKDRSHDELHKSVPSRDELVLWLNMELVLDTKLGPLGNEDMQILLVHGCIETHRC